MDWKSGVLSGLGTVRRSATCCQSRLAEVLSSFVIAADAGMNQASLHPVSVINEVRGRSVEVDVVIKRPQAVRGHVVGAGCFE